jgi:hypothetical protein
VTGNLACYADLNVAAVRPQSVGDQIGVVVEALDA